MIRRTPRSTRTDTLFPYTTLFRSAAFGLVQLDKLDRNIAAREHNFKRQLDFFSRYEEWFILPRQMPASRTGWLAFPLTIRPDAPFTRTQMQIWFERSEERRVGKEWCSTLRAGWAPVH